MNLQKKSIFTILLLVTCHISIAQNKKIQEDSSQIIFALKHGKIKGNMRYFFMATNNENSASNSSANAAGLGLSYESGNYKGFQLGIAQYSIFNVASTDMTYIDPKTNLVNRYETGLFDQEHVEKRSDINRLENLYVKYHSRSTQIIIGKQTLNTPFINLQDGRMRPTVVGGIWSEINTKPFTKVEGGILWEVMPRGTAQWHSIGESMSVYPSGVNIDGSKSNYAKNISSNYIGMLGITHQIIPEVQLKIWDVYVNNVFNTTLLQTDLKKKNWILGFQYIHQNGINEGGNSEINKAYFSKNQQANVWGGRIAWEKNAWKTSFNFTRITSDGRYLMPREWGRDPFYTFMPRERNEGYGDLVAYVSKVSYQIKKTSIQVQTSLGYFQLPDVKNFTLNKYGMPSYWQWNLEINYPLQKLLKGMEVQGLYVYKKLDGNTFDNEKYVINKVNMSNYNLVINYHF